MPLPVCSHCAQCDQLFFTGASPCRWFGFSTKAKIKKNPSTNCSVSFSEIKKKIVLNEFICRPHDSGNTLKVAIVNRGISINVSRLETLKNSEENSALYLSGLHHLAACFHCRLPFIVSRRQRIRNCLARVQIFHAGVEVYSGAASRQGAVPVGAPSRGFLFLCLGSPADLAALYLFPPIPVDAADSPSSFCGLQPTRAARPRRRSWRRWPLSPQLDKGHALKNRHALIQARRQAGSRGTRADR